MLLGVSGAAEKRTRPRFCGVRLTRQSTPAVRVPITPGTATRNGSHEDANGEIDAHAYGRQREQDEPQLLRVHRRAARSHGPAAQTPPHGHTVGMADAF